MPLRTYTIKVALAYAGTSSFGMSGVNCHLLLSHPKQPLHHAGDSSIICWRHERVWAVPPLNALLLRVQPADTGSKTSFTCDVTAPALAFLWDHRCDLSSLGMVCMPGAHKWTMRFSSLHGQAFDFYTSSPITVNPESNSALFNMPWS